MKDLESLMIYKQYMELIYYTENIVKKYPKNEKNSLVASIKNTTYDGMKDIIKAQKEKDKSKRLFYLNELDMYIKHKLKIKYVIRYLDDLIILLKDREECRIVKDKINNFIFYKLKLELNKKSRYYPSNIGINFCGYRIFETHRLLRVRSKYKIKRNIIVWNKNRTC